MTLTPWFGLGPHSLESKTPSVRGAVYRASRIFRLRVGEWCLVVLAHRPVESCVCCILGLKQECPVGRVRSLIVRLASGMHHEAVLFANRARETRLAVNPACGVDVQGPTSNGPAPASATEFRFEHLAALARANAVFGACVRRYLTAADDLAGAG